MIVIARMVFKDKEADLLRAKGDTWEVSNERGKLLISRFVCFEVPESTNDVQPKTQNNPTQDSGKRGRGGRKSRG